MLFFIVAVVVVVTASVYCYINSNIQKTIGGEGVALMHFFVFKTEKTKQNEMNVEYVNNKKYDNKINLKTS